ncbi:MAG: redox-regulated ATPase YchF [Eubacteriaceae bacterium]|nr:redox-regulated ATPase YchF [Eubacteriaceae bacterium]
MKIGLVGLPNVGKSTLFNALTSAGALASNYMFSTKEANIGVVQLPDYRLDKLCELYDTKSRVSASVEFVDIAGLVRNSSKGEGLGNQFLSYIRNVNAILEVVRCFGDENVMHVDGAVDPVRDAKTIKDELAFSDLEILEKRIHTLSKTVQGAAADEKAHLAALIKARDSLYDGVSLYAAEFSEQELAVLAPYNLLTFKQILYCANVDEEHAAAGNEHSDALKAYISEFEPNNEMIIICAKYEAEISDFGEEDKLELLGGIGLSESGLNKVIRKSFELLGLITFFTAGKKECRAWEIRNGTRAQHAAGKIHSDFEKKFIRAEVTKFDKLVEAGNDVRAKELAFTRVEGKEYVIEDGDVVYFRVGA